LRIIAGEAKGRRIIAPPGRDIRPTSDRVKESLFNILGDKVPDSVVLDLFAGTGNLGLESLSRGAKLSIFIDSNRESIKLIYENIKLLKFEEACEVYHNDASSALTILNRKGVLFDIIFVDPPYHKNMVPVVINKISELGLLKDDGVIAAEHDVKDLLPDRISDIVSYKTSIYGDTGLTFYRKY
jgi:16S rRNA (guanine(966)-N(2))-methyltransferase RsmD